MDNIKNGQRINCNGVYGTVVKKKSTRNQRLVLVKMDNGFTLKLEADALSVFEQPVEIRKASSL
jgi:preprotein translocase subunit YajC